MRILAIACSFAILFASSCDNKNSKAEIKSKNEMAANDSAAIPAPSRTDTTVAPPKDEYTAKLQGKWQSVDDPKDVVEFVGNKKLERYENEPTSESTFRIIDNKIETTDIPEGYKMEYGIDFVTEERLSLVYIGRGNTLSYKKIK